MEKKDKKGSLDKFNFVSMDELKEMEDNATKDNEKVELEDYSSLDDQEGKKLIFTENAIPEVFSDVNFEDKEIDKEIAEVTKSRVGTIDEEKVLEVTEEFKLEKSEDKKKKKRFYFGFEQRVAISVILILILFAGACGAILEAINYGNDTVIGYSEVANSSYNVCVQADEYEDTCLPEGMEYVSAITDKILANFDYKVDFSEPTNYDFSYHIMAVMKIYDRLDNSKVLYESEEIIVEQTKFSSTDRDVRLSDSIEIDYNKFNNYVIGYKNKYGLDVESDMEVILFVDDKNELREVSSLTIPLGEQTYGIKKDGISNLNKTVSLNTDNWGNVNTIWAFLGTALILVALFLLYKTTRLVLRVTNNKNKFQTTLNNLLRDYDRDIVIARNGYESIENKKVIKVLNFNELLDAKNALNKPIIYSRVNDVKSEFIVEDDDKIFKYVIKEADFM